MGLRPAALKSAAGDAHDAGLRLAMLMMLDLVLLIPGPWRRLMLMIRGLRPAALKSAAGDAHDARPEAGFAAKRVAS